MKKEVILLLAVIAALSAYLVFQKTDKVAYELPQLAEIAEKEITKIEIKTPENTVSLQRSASGWKIAGKSYLPDKSRIKKILKDITGLTLTAMVSESGAYERYDLGNDRKVSVTVWQGSDKVLSLDIGKDAGTRRHTFIKLADDGNIYHAQGSFRKDFDTSAEMLRDKTVLAVNKDEIQTIRLARKDKTLTLVRQGPEVAVDAVSEADAMDADRNSPASPQLPQWRTDDGKTASAKEVEDLLGQLSHLTCQRFVYEKTEYDTTTPIYTITLSGAAEYAISIFDKGAEEANEYPAKASGSDDLFILPKWQAEKLMKDFEKVVSPDTAS